MKNAENEKEMISILTNRFNQWWVNRKIEVPPFRRRDFDYILKRIDEDKAITLIGPRQTGKTTIVKQVIKELIDARGINPKRVFYVELDDIKLMMLSENNLLLDVLEVYQKYILQEDLNLTAQDTFIFLDEVQRVENWAEQVKGFCAANKKIHLLSTGSASFQISQKSKETLPGRQELFTMFPLKFADALALYQSVFGGKIELEKLKRDGYELRAGFESALQGKTFGGFYALCKKHYLDYAPYENELNSHLLRYFSKGGYPEIVATENVPACQKLLVGYANDIILKDLMPWFKIRDFESAEKLLFLLASVSGEQLNASELAKRLPGKNYATISRYISYFESLNVMGEVPVYSGKRMGGAKHPKIYLYDVGLRNAVYGVLDAPFTDTEKGHLAETVAYDHLRRLCYKLNSSSAGHISCYQGNWEVDFVAEFAKYSLKLPIEVKYRKAADARGVSSFLEKSGGKLGMVITAEQLELKNGVLYLPFWMFLLMC